jgi:hypothetical protein
MAQDQEQRLADMQSQIDDLITQVAELQRQRREAEAREVTLRLEELRSMQLTLRGELHGTQDAIQTEMRAWTRVMRKEANGFQEYVRERMTGQDAAIARIEAGQQEQTVTLKQILALLTAGPGQN